MLPKNAINSLLPEPMNERAVENLVVILHERIMDDPELRDALEACNLQPTYRAATLAAMCAVNVILAHELGQEVAADELHYEAAEPTA